MPAPPPGISPRAHVRLSVLLTGPAAAIREEGGAEEARALFFTCARLLLFGLPLCVRWSATPRLHPALSVRRGRPVREVRKAADVSKLSVPRLTGFSLITWSSKLMKCHVRVL